MPPSPKRACHGTPCSSTPQHPDCQCVRGPLTRSPWQPAGFTRSVAFRPPIPQRALQLNPAAAPRQPLGSPFFFDFRWAALPVNSFKLNHLDRHGQGAVPNVSPSPRRLAAGPATALKDISPANRRQPLTGTRFLRGRQ